MFTTFNHPIGFTTVISGEACIPAKVFTEYLKYKTLEDLKAISDQPQFDDLGVVLVDFKEDLEAIGDVTYALSVRVSDGDKISLSGEVTNVIPEGLTIDNQRWSETATIEEINSYISTLVTLH